MFMKKQSKQKSNKNEETHGFKRQLEMSNSKQNLRKKVDSGKGVVGF